VKSNANGSISTATNFDGDALIHLTISQTPPYTNVRHCPAPSCRFHRCQTPPYAKLLVLSVPHTCAKPVPPVPHTALRQVAGSTGATHHPTPSCWFYQYQTHAPSRRFKQRQTHAPSRLNSATHIRQAGSTGATHAPSSLVPPVPDTCKQCHIPLCAKLPVPPMPHTCAKLPIPPVPDTCAKPVKHHHTPPCAKLPVPPVPHTCAKPVQTPPDTNVRHRRPFLLIP
jgi:hypothetical protein